ncbi:MAG: sulfotransferase family protein [Pseudomonadota bacterium]
MTRAREEIVQPATRSADCLRAIANHVGGFLLNRGVIRLPMVADALLEAACRRAGLDDFGDPAFEMPFRLLVRSLREEAPLSFFGRVAARQDLLGLLTGRLHIEAAFRTTPRMAGERIVEPVFIIGLPRAGTTFLHELLAQDPAHRAPLCWETMYPHLRPGTSARADAASFARARRDLRWFHRVTPEIRGIHAVAAGAPQECVAIKSFAFESSRFDSTYVIPSYKDWFESSDHAAAYAYHRRFLQYLQHGSMPRPWVLKAPGHIAQLRALGDTYPDARFIQVNRDPLKVVPSIASLTVALRGAFCTRADEAAIAADVASRWSGFLAELPSRRREIDPTGERTLDLAFDEVVRSPLEAVVRIYRWLGRPLPEETRACMTAYVERAARASAPRHRYDLRDFGLDPAALRERFRAYTESYGVRLEVT